MMPHAQGAIYVRMLTGFVLAGVAVVVIWVPWLTLGFLAFVATLATLGLYEYYAMARVKGQKPEVEAGILAGAAVTLSGYWANPVLTGLVLFFGIAAVAALHIARGNHSLEALAVSAFGVLYVGWMAAHFVLLHRVPHTGPGLVTLLAVAIIWSDAGAYFVGKTVGRHKLAPKVSPNKTWEGSLGGVIGAVASMAVLYWLRGQFAWHGLPAWPVARYLWVGAVLSVVGQIGDLVESMMKRDAGIKDSGSTFPGHGGALDRCDGFIFAGPVLYYLIQFWPR